MAQFQLAELANPIERARARRLALPEQEEHQHDRYGGEPADREVAPAKCK
jgi:hypothetical protein